MRLSHPTNLKGLESSDMRIYLKDLIKQFSDMKWNWSNTDWIKYSEKGSRICQYNRYDDINATSTLAFCTLWHFQDRPVKELIVLSGSTPDTVACSKHPPGTHIMLKDSDFAYYGLDDYPDTPVVQDGFVTDNFDVDRQAYLFDLMFRCYPKLEIWAWQGIKDSVEKVLGICPQLHGDTNPKLNHDGHWHCAFGLPDMRKRINWNAVLC